MAGPDEAVPGGRIGPFLALGRAGELDELVGVLFGLFGGLGVLGVNRGQGHQDAGLVAVFNSGESQGLFTVPEGFGVGFPRLDEGLEKERIGESVVLPALAGVLGDIILEQGGLFLGGIGLHGLDIGLIPLALGETEAAQESREDDDGQNCSFHP